MKKEKRKARKKAKILITIMILIALALLIVGVLFMPSRIKLKGKSTIKIAVGEEYKEQGATSKYLFFDNTKDIKVTGKVDIEKVGKYKIKYSIKEKISKKITTKYRTVIVTDNIKPTITLNGGNISLYLNKEYTEYGYTASDNIDGDITDKVTIEGAVDNTKIGEYTLTYKVKDSSDNEAKETRKVTVIKDKTGAKKVPVLMYHNFYDDTAGEKGDNGNWMSKTSFDAQVKYLVDNDYYFPSWAEMYDYVLGNIALPENSIVLTSDDGHESFYRIAYPIIKKYDAKITAFVIGRWTKKEHIISYKDHVYFESHTFDMHKAGCSGQGHGGYFNCVSYEEGLADLKKSIDLIGNDYAIAYPYGDFNDNIRQITKDAGIKMGFTTAYDYVYPGDDPLELSRIRMSRDDSLNAFINKIS